jgi:uncharacterized protein
MPGNYTYPGVYVEEIPSGVRTITGVSTADTAFIDIFKRGPVNQATRLTSFTDFERVFGGLDVRSQASYAIQQYYLNGGQIAWVVRVTLGSPGTASLDLLGSSPPQTTLTVAAANPGSWGNNLQVAVTSQQPFNLFNLFVREVKIVNGRTQVLNPETYRNLSMNKTSPRYAPEVVNKTSRTIQLTDAGIGSLPAYVAPNGSGLPPDTAYQNLMPIGNDGVFLDETGSLVDPAGFASLIADPLSKHDGIYSLDRIAPYIFNILCIPATAKLSGGDLKTVVDAATAYCEDKRAFFILDIAPDVTKLDTMANWVPVNNLTVSRNAAVYFPRLEIPDALNGNRLRNVGPSGTLAGIYARTDATRGVWKAPAGTEATLRGASLTVILTDLENGGLNPLGINVLRNFPIFGNVAWGARTLEGSDQQASEWKYIPVRRTALYIEESLYQGLKWVVFEPNDEPLWAQIRLNVGAFMHNLFRQGAFQGGTPREAYFVKCDRETTTQNDINLGVVNIVVGFAPLKPAEFVVLQIQQMAGQIET